MLNKRQKLAHDIIPSINTVWCHVGHGSKDRGLFIMSSSSDSECFDNSVGRKDPKPYLFEPDRKKCSKISSANVNQSDSDSSEGESGSLQPVQA